MRIIGGKYKNIKLVPPTEKMKVRPICDSCKELIFNALSGYLCSKNGHPVYQGRVADLYAGTGALGIEAISRGAESVCFVDKSLLSLQIVSQNLNKIGASAHLIRSDVTRLGKAQADYDLIFIDPPFNFGLVEPSLIRLAKMLWVNENTICVVRIDPREKLQLPTGYYLVQEKTSSGRVLFLSYKNKITE